MIHLDKTKTNIVPVRLEVLSPVFIGSGEMLSPLNYQVVQNPDGYWVYTLDYDAWISSLEGEKALEYAEKFSRSSLQEVWEILRKDMPKEAYLLSKSKTSEDIYKKYLDRLKSGMSSNEFSSALRNPLNQAMILAGSSIKGAIRTAIIDSKDNGELKATQRGDRRQDSREYNDRLESLFGKIGENAFQALKISDFELLNNESEFVKAVEISQKPEKPINDMKGICEIAPSSTQDKYGKITLGRFSKFDNKKTPLAEWTFEKLAEVCNSYYRSRLLSEYAKFYKLPQFASTKPFVEAMLDKLNSNTAKQAILLRVGHFSHIECVTVEKNKPETRKTRDGKQMPYGTTRTLANGKFPFGWVLLHKCSLDEYDEGKRAFAQAQEEIKSSFLELRNREEEILRKKLREEEEIKAQREKSKQEAELARLAHEAEIQKQKEEAERIKQEKLQKAEEAKELQEEENARLAALSPLDRAFEKTLAKIATREEVLTAFDNIDSYADKIQLAEAIKAFWQKEKMWADKKMKKNQEDRVKKVQEILKEKI